MTQLVITLKDQSYLPNIRRIVKSLQGVESVRTPRKRSTTGRKPKTTAHVRKGQKTVLDEDYSDPLEALDNIGQLVRSTGKSSEQLIDEYLAEKYGI